MGFPPAEAQERASLDFIWAVVNQRTIKSEEEIAEIEKAVATSVTMHEAAIRMARPGMMEMEIAVPENCIADDNDGDGDHCARHLYSGP